METNGDLTTDSVGLGLACDAQSRALTRDGTAQGNLFIAGPLARGTFGELTGVPEIAAQAQAIARQILGEIASPAQEQTGRTF